MSARRRRNGREKAQKGKHRKRRPDWHSGRAQGKVNDRVMAKALPAFERAEQDRVEVAAAAAEFAQHIEEWNELIESVARVSPALLAPTVGRNNL